MTGECFISPPKLPTEFAGYMPCGSDCMLYSASVIVETDSTAIASRVSRPKADTTEIVINEQTLMSAYLTVKDKVQQRIQQL